MDNLYFGLLLIAFVLWLLFKFSGGRKKLDEKIKEMERELQKK